MRLLLLTSGSRGDVQPFVALGKALKAAGHDVGVCTHEGFEPVVARQGLTYLHMNNRILDLFDDPAFRSFLDPRRNPFRKLGSLRHVLRIMWPAMRQTLDEVWAAARGADAVIHYPKALGGAHIAEKLGVPSFSAMYLPFVTPTDEFPLFAFRDRGWGRWYNRATHAIPHLTSAIMTPMVNRWRKELLGLPSRPWWRGEMVRRPGETTLYAFSRHLITPASDWPEDVHVTGTWFMDEQSDLKPPPALKKFLDSGDPPVYVGFGSMPTSDPGWTTRMVVDAFKIAGCRGIMAAGWGGLDATSLKLPDDIIAVAQAPHAWLFPRCSAIVHHGGAGTTAAAVRAGRPALVCPFFGDQPFWGRRIYELGAGPKPISQRRLNARRLAQMIRTMTTNFAMRDRTEELGRKIREEGGVAAAVEIIDRRLRGEAASGAA